MKGNFTMIFEKVAEILSQQFEVDRNIITADSDLADEEAIELIIKAIET